TLTFDTQRPIVNREMLLEAGLRKRWFPFDSEIDIDESAAAAVIVVALEETIGGATVGIDVGPVDLKAQLRGRSPDQAAHAPVADGNALFASWHRPVINQIGP